MHFSVFVGAAIAALVARIFLPFLKGLISPLRTIPGPIAARFTDFWYTWRIWRGAFEWDNIELHQKYGESYSCALTHQATLENKRPRKSFNAT
jgi:hypothetical protein